MDSEERYMWMALDLARRGQGRTSPNPVVGAVLVKDGEVVGTGYHQNAGGPHAEIFALEEAGNRARGATLYVNLEPCVHYGKTPPCVDAIIKAGVKKVVIATEDPNPEVRGKGIKKLRENGIRVKTGVLEEKALRLNEVFFKYIQTGMPFITVKAAMTLDGKIATSTGESRWITGEKARKYVHKLRYYADGIVVGIRTVLADDPLLTVRLEGYERKGPKRIVVDSKASLPLNARVITASDPTDTILATTEKAPLEKRKALAEKGVEVLVLPEKNDRVDLKALMKALGERKMSNILVEGGGTLNYALLEENLVDKLYIFIAPLLIGGAKAQTPLAGEGIKSIKDARIVREIELKQFDGDLLLIGYPEKRGDQNIHRYYRGTGDSVVRAIS
ncbi:MAG: bifunctional diaminohydroxyphosphoribosylaminopyrimidine deaminase/5-amino-6-(5-phosphoribosylamino)uracil reductase RibD [Firmicutes bacterium]|nr:bifunctional diaminohydroxyphosphoribosylaminopyrimidine deaminase/5-amino-6-(5-phosphoribosylamino)uracil reductase RibD [Bacillota bacterium]